MRRSLVGAADQGFQVGMGQREPGYVGRILLAKPRLTACRAWSSLLCGV